MSINKQLFDDVELEHKSKKNIKDYGLSVIIENDGSLDSEDKIVYMSLANLYEKDFKNNLGLTSLALDEKYQTNQPSLWQRFLAHTSVRNFIDEYIYEDVEKKAMMAIGSGITDSNKALKAKEVIDKKKKREDNNMVVVLRLPEKEDIDSIL